MNCPTCGKENEPSAQFCGECGSQLSGQQATAIQYGVDSSNSMVGFRQAIKLGFGKYLEFDGRATRAEYWWWQLFVVLVSWVPIIGSIIWLATLIPGLAVTSRRLHDVGRTGWWQVLPWGVLVVFFLALIFGFVLSSVSEDSIWLQKAPHIAPTLFILAGISILAVIPVLILLLVWYCTRGENGTNKYGPEPRIIGK
jgi:uncharacterized membrane protein YhaH (DUF805 family)